MFMSCSILIFGEGITGAIPSVASVVMLDVDDCKEMLFDRIAWER